MSILSTAEQIEFLLTKHAGVAPAELAAIIAERVDAQPVKPADGGNGGEALKKIITGIGKAAAEQQKAKTRTRATELADQAAVESNGVVEPA